MHALCDSLVTLLVQVVHTIIFISIYGVTGYGKVFPHATMIGVDDWWRAYYWWLCVLPPQQMTDWVA